MGDEIHAAVGRSLTPGASVYATMALLAALTATVAGGLFTLVTTACEQTKTRVE